MTFYEWIMKYHLDDNSPIGSLAGYMMKDHMCPKDGMLKDYERYFRQRNVREFLIKALKEAFVLYESDIGAFS